jgi:hypothetical protein
MATCIGIIFMILYRFVELNIIINFKVEDEDEKK